MRAKAILVSVLLLIGVPAAIMFVPIPSYVRASGQLGRAQEIVVRARQDGFVSEVDVTTGMEVNADDIWARLDNPDLTEKVLEAQAELKASGIQLAAYRASSGGGLSAAKQEEFGKASRLQPPCRIVLLLVK